MLLEAAGWHGCDVSAANILARAFVQSNPNDAPTHLMEELGYGRAYRYFPDDIDEQNWYQPTPRGLEGKIAEKLAHLRKLDEEAGKG